MRETRTAYEDRLPRTWAGRATPAPGDKLSPERVTELRAVFEFGPTRTLQMDVEYDILRIVTSCTEQFGEKETMRVDQEFTGKS